MSTAKIQSLLPSNADEKYSFHSLFWSPFIMWLCVSCDWHFLQSVDGCRWSCGCLFIHRKNDIFQLNTRVCQWNGSCEYNSNFVCHSSALKNSIELEFDEKRSVSKWRMAVMSDGDYLTLSVRVCSMVRIVIPAGERLTDAQTNNNKKRWNEVNAMGCYFVIIIFVSAARSTHTPQFNSQSVAHLLVCLNKTKQKIEDLFVLFHFVFFTIFRCRVNIVQQRFVFVRMPIRWHLKCVIFCLVFAAIWK